MNPGNVVTLYGRVSGTPEILKDKRGTEFAARMVLAVKRNYRNREGEYEEDMIPVKFCFDEGRKSFAHTIEAGDLVQISGALKTESYQGKRMFYVQSDMLSFDEMTRRRKYGKKEGDQLVSGTFPIDLPLPY